MVTSDHRPPSVYATAELKVCSTLLHMVQEASTGNHTIGFHRPLRRVWFPAHAILPLP